MVSTEVRIDTDNARRYLAQLCRHATAMADRRGHRIRRRHAAGTEDVAIDVEWSKTDGIIAFGSWGRCTVRADPAALSARIDAVDEEKLGRIQGIIGRNLERFGRRESTTVIWQPIPAAQTSTKPGAHDRTSGKPGPHRGRLTTIAVTAAAVIAVAIHLGLGGTVLMNSHWARGAVGAVLVIVVIKAAIVLGGSWLRRTRSHPSR